MTAEQRRAAALFAQILRALDQAAPAQVRQIEAALKAAASAVTLDDLEKALKRNPRLPRSTLEPLAVKSHAAILKALLVATEIVGPLHAAELAFLLDTKVTWPTFRAVAARWSRERAAKLVTEIVKDTRQALANVARDAFLDELTARQVANRVKENIGLHSKQSAALERYRQRVERAVERGKLTAGQGRQKVRVYRDRLLRYRSDTIARSEMITASSEAQRIIWESSAKAGALDVQKYLQEWIAILRDGRVCKWCYGLHGQRVKIGKPFTGEDGWSGPGPTRHPRCRCQKRLVRKGEARGSMPAFVEPQKGRGLQPKI